MSHRNAAAATRRTHARAAAPAFTLSELITVLAIVAILSAILFPLLSRSREKARQASCLDNQRQMSAAWLMYAQDNDGKVVPWSVSGRSASDAFIWDRLIEPYHKNPDAIRCPSGPGKVGYSYSANVGGASPSPPLRALSSLHNPAQTPIIADCPGFSDPTRREQTGWSFSFVIPDEKGGHQARAIYYGSIENGVPTHERRWFAPPTAERTAAATISADRHFGGANYIFADGHTKWLAKEVDSKGRPMPARKGLDYDSDGVLGDDDSAGTTGKYD
jgi:prepilin-type N-terminal cleavage/methylation domain